ncbi:MAG: ATP-binding protein, partial [bacterium]|nr:ATP-binding protein [bacterium]
MRANPGGEIAPSEVVGRDRLIQRIRQALEQQSVILVAERR